MKTDKAFTPAEVEVKNLTKTFGKTIAVNNISFTLSAGSVVGFVGPNGSGKTTSLKIMATIDEPDSGDILINGKSIVQYPEAGRDIIGFMPDSLPNQGDITAIEYLDFFGRTYGLNGTDLKSRLNEVIEFTGLAELKDKTLAALSKGMKQRVSLSRAIMHNPSVLLLDEPAAGLDPRARIELRDMINALAKQGKTIFISSHILSELAEMCDKFIIIERGNLLQSGTLKEIAEQSRTQGDKFLEILIRTGNDALLEPELNNLKTRNLIVDFVKTGDSWLIKITGNEAESAELLKILIKENITIYEFYHRKSTLEDIFMTVTKGELA